MRGIWPPLEGKCRPSTHAEQDVTGTLTMRVSCKLPWWSEQTTATTVSGFRTCSPAMDGIISSRGTHASLLRRPIPRSGVHNPLPYAASSLGLALCLLATPSKMQEQQVKRAGSHGQDIGQQKEVRAD